MFSREKCISTHFIEILSNENDTVLDFFMGVWTTAIACKQTNRNFIGFEIDKNYCNIGQKRLDKIPKARQWF